MATMTAGEALAAVALMFEQDMLPPKPECGLLIPAQPPKREPAPPKPKFKKTWHQHGRKRK